MSCSRVASACLMRMARLELLLGCHWPLLLVALDVMMVTGHRRGIGYRMGQRLFLGSRVGWADLLLLLDLPCTQVCTVVGGRIVPRVKWRCRTTRCLMIFSS